MAGFQKAKIEAARIFRKNKLENKVENVRMHTTRFGHLTGPSGREG